LSHGLILLPVEGPVCIQAVIPTCGIEPHLIHPAGVEVSPFKGFAYKKNNNGKTGIHVNAVNGGCNKSATMQKVRQLVNVFICQLAVPERGLQFKLTNEG
jgi:hypothetical protein